MQIDDCGCGTRRHCGRAGPAAPEGAPTTPALRRLLENDGKVDRVATISSSPTVRSGFDGALVFTDAPRGQVLRWHEGEEPAVIAEDSGGASGLALDASRRLVAAERDRRRVSRREDGEVTAIVERVGGAALNGPTDVAIAPDGTLTSRRAAVERPHRHRGSGRARVNGRSLRRRCRGAEQAVGPGRWRRGHRAVRGRRRPTRRACLSVDLRRASGGTSHAGRDRAVEAGRAGARRRHDPRPGRPSLPGRPGGIWILDRNGGRLGVIATPETPRPAPSATPMAARSTSPRRRASTGSG